MKRKSLVILCVCIITGLLATAASAGALNGYSLAWWTVDGGGGSTSAGASYSLDGTIGQPDPGVSSGGAFSLTGGLWNAHQAGNNGPLQFFLPIFTR